MITKVYESFVLNTIDRIKTFVFANSDSPCQVDVLKDRYTVDGKSIMGLFSMEVSRPLRVTISGTKEEVEKLDAVYREKGLI